MVNPMQLLKDGELLDRITYDRDILGGKPIIKGTRISVSLILNLLAHGLSTEDVLAEHPHLQLEDILAAIRIYSCNQP